MAIDIAHARAYTRAPAFAVAIAVILPSTRLRVWRTEREAFRLHGVTITGYRPPLRIVALRLLARSIALAGVLALVLFFML